MSEKTQKVYVGHGNATGDVMIFDFSPSSGTLAPVGTVSTGASTSYLAFAPGGRFAYTTQNRSNRVSAFAVEPNGLLRKLGDAAVPAGPESTDAGPAYVSVDARGRFLLCANYRGHNVVVFQLNDDGGLGPVVTNVAPGKHAHCAVIAPGNRHVFVPCLGADLVAQFVFDQVTGALVPNDPPAVKTRAGAGPRHLAFAPQDRPGADNVFLINELDATLGAYRYDRGRGVLEERATVATLPADYTGQRWGADVHVHPNGRFVYVSNRAHDSVAVFGTEDLALIQRVGCGGKTPRNFALDPSGRSLLVANQDGANLTLFAIDPETGHLHARGEQAVASNPYFVKIVG
jgi:6-phosphogluconolactonase